MISGREFAQCCRWVVDPRYPDRDMFDYGKACSGDWVFVNGDFFHWFFQCVPFVSAKKFVFIVHNSDRSFGQSELTRLLPHALHIYAINTVIQHPLLTTIPIGFVDRQSSFLSTFNPGEEERTIEIYMNFTTLTNSEKRSECARVFEHDPRTTVRQGLSVEDYYRDLSRSKFVLCPEGTGIDTHRVYESILCGATPVVLRNSLAHLYETLPVCIIDAWTDPFYVPVRKDFRTKPTDYL